ncbi:uncharacterized protein PV06_11237 [Exophiala oligosperma]|uniref:Protein kinase domain-containing protein n=1 Tax=Exophiala oligosperma TaxID=215243 RepID=A0A0D2A8A9_9EURO|nr:uncharacterized protein PV06_11237 [Exophiala oligosperma]KIW36526.1 hypothetical protein PV06_11237 [Exophiala oligosperma]
MELTHANPTTTKDINWLREFETLNDVSGDLESGYVGTTGVVIAYNATEVIKHYHADDRKARLQREAEAYLLLGEHPNIGKYLGPYYPNQYSDPKDTPSGIVLERGIPLPIVLRKGLDISMKFRIIRDLCDGLCHVHSSDILFADVGCHNAILVKGIAKWVDFEGCGIRGLEPTAFYKTSYCRSSMANVSKSTDIFAFGCMVYQIETGITPYHIETAGLDDDQTAAYTEAKFSASEFPNTCGLTFQGVIDGCWSERFISMQQVALKLSSMSL